MKQNNRSSFIEKGRVDSGKDRMLQGTLSELWDMSDMFQSPLLLSEHKDCSPTLEKKLVGRFP